MHDIPKSSSDKKMLYAGLHEGVAAMIEGERDFVANTAKVSAMLFHTLPDINWSGFYFLMGQELVLGPFQGKPA